MAAFMVNQTISTRVADWVYWVMKDILKTPSKFWWNKKQTTLTTVDGTAEYFLSHRVSGADIIWMGDNDRQGFEIQKTTLERIYRYDSTPTDEGDPVVWAFVDQSEVQASNTAATISVVSDNAADTAMTLTVRGQVSGIERYENVTLNGLTPAVGSLTFTADTITSCSLSANCVGVVTVTTGATTIVSIPPGLQRIQCPRIRLWRVPGSVLTLPYIYYQKAMKPINAGDIVDIPDEGFDALLKGLFYWGHKNNGDTREAEGSLQEYQIAKRELISWSQHEPTKVDKKYWPQRAGDLQPSLPRLIVATVT